MALESATYIDDLNTSNPSPTDLLAQGDDHIRLIKAVLKATFPNISGPVELDQDEINALASLGTPVGVITAWYGSSGSVPSGWAICDGSTVAKSDGSGNITVPDLRDKVVLGAGTVASQGATHGAATASATTASGGDHSHGTSGGAHSHPGLAVAGHALTISEMPAHTHTAPSNPNTSGGGLFQSSGGTPGTLTTNSAGGGAAHSHDLTWPETADGSHSHTVETAGAHTHGVTVSTYQPSLALHYIMKV